MLPIIIRIMEEGKERKLFCRVERMGHETCVRVYEKSIIIMNNQLCF